MTNLIKLAEELKEKQTWVRKGLETWLSEWEAATQVEINDPALERVKLCKSGQDAYWHIWYVKRGDSVAYRIWDEFCDSCRWSEAKKMSVDEMSMETIRGFVGGIAQAITKYQAALEAACIECEELAHLLPKE